MGFLHIANSPEKPIGIIYCHPFAEEKNMSHAIMVKSARKFASSGYHVFRFDYSASGDSEGELCNTTLSDWQQDLNAAIKIFKKETGISNYILWGLRLGAGMALIQAEHDKSVKGLALWQPVLNFSVYIKQFMRQAISTSIAKTKKEGMENKAKIDNEESDVVNIIGYPITKELYNSFENVGEKPGAILSLAPVLVLSVSMLDQAAPNIETYVEELIRNASNTTYHHIKETPFWDRYWQWECDLPAIYTLAWLNEITT